MKYIAVIDPPIPQLTKDQTKELALHKKDPKNPKPKIPKPKERILVGAFNTPYKAAIARDAAMKKLGFDKSFYNPKKETSPAVNRVTTPKKAIPRDRRKMITLGKLKKDEQRKNKANNQKNATK